MEQPLSAPANNYRLAIIAILSGVFLASLSDAFIKFYNADFPLWQIFVLRSAITIPVLILIIKLRQPILRLTPLNIGWSFLRSFLLVFMWLSYYIALPKVALSVAAAVYYTLPLFITLFAAVFVGEKVDVKGWLTIVIGFIGMCLILKPRSDDFSFYALLPLASAIFYAIAMILTRTKIRQENPLVLSLNLNLAFIIVGVVGTLFSIHWGTSNAQMEANSFLFGYWVPMDVQAWLVIATLALLITTGSQCATVAYQNGPSSIVSSFDFFYLVFIVMWGIIIFGEVPDVVTVSGIVLICGAGAVIVRK